MFKNKEGFWVSIKTQKRILEEKKKLYLTNLKYCYNRFVFEKKLNPNLVCIGFYIPEFSIDVEGENFNTSITKDEVESKLEELGLSYYDVKEIDDSCSFNKVVVVAVTRPLEENEKIHNDLFINV